MAAETGDSLHHFNFLVDFGEGDIAGFTEVSGLGLDADDSGGNSVVLKRGVCAGPKLLEWLSSVHGSGGEARDVTVRLFDEVRRPILEWTLTGARPFKQEGPALDAKTRELAVEAIEILCEQVTLNLHSGDGPN